MEDLASANWILEQTKRQFQVFNISFNPKDNEPVQKTKNFKSSSTARKRKRPRESLAVLIYQAMRHHRRKLTVSEISDYICDKYAYYKVRKHWTVGQLYFFGCLEII